MVKTVRNAAPPFPSRVSSWPVTDPPASARSKAAPKASPARTGSQSTASLPTTSAAA